MMSLNVYAHLVIKDAPRAMDWYQEVLGAREVLRYTDPTGRIVYAELAIGDSRVALAEENRPGHNHAPPSLGGTTVHLTLETDDAHGIGKRMIEHGAKVIYPIEDQFYGDRQGRLADPFGHEWIITQKIEALSPEEIQRRIDNYKP
jgi:PhnB protein